MEATDLRYLDPRPTRTTSDAEMLLEHCPLDGARVLELGCGPAQEALELLGHCSPAAYVASDPDAQQHAKNLASKPQPPLEFRLGGAESIADAPDSFDVVIMLRSLHHVPPADMPRALTEIARVLRPDGSLWIAEPVYDGPLNALLSLFHDERDVRAKAFDTVRDAVTRGRFQIRAQHFYGVERHFQDFADFDRRILQATHTEHALSPELREQVRERFESHTGPDGARFVSPVRVEHLAV